MEFLKENAEYFEKKAFEAIKEKPKFVLFFSEQALQLYVKYILTKELGDYPKTHNLRILFNELAKINDKAKVFYEDNADVFDLLEEAYVTARYLNKEYSNKKCRKSFEPLEIEKI